jgi:hypothetical protein
MERALYETEKKPLDEGDRLRLGAEQAALSLELGKVKEEKKDVSSVYRVKIRELEEKIHTIASSLDEGAFEVKFEVLEEPDDERQVIDVKRKDTGERINTRPMTEVEKEASRKRKQGELFPDEVSDTEPPPGKVRGLFGRNPKAKAPKKNGRR